MTLTKDLAIGAFLQYGSGLPLAPPAATNTNYIGGSEQYPGPRRSRCYLKNLNCGCINPYYDQVLNPGRMGQPRQRNLSDRPPEPTTAISAPPAVRRRTLTLAGPSASRSTTLCRSARSS